MKEIFFKDKDFPKILKEIPSPPKKIFMRGEYLPQDETAIAIVGARKCSNYGKQVAYDIAYELAKKGVTVISGLALGIDSEAHKGALDAGGRTLAVLGSGIDDKSIYPYSHKSLAEKIIENGALISEYEPGTPGYKGNFPQRNRIVSGLSMGIVVVEANEKSGSLITARLGLDQGKDIFAVPGSIYSKASSGTNKLIQEGAKLIRNTNDILEELEIAGVNFNTEKNGDNLSENEKSIVDFLINDAKHIDDIVKKLNISISDVLTSITTLEMKGKIKNLGNNIFVLNIQ